MDKERVSAYFIITSDGLPWHGWLLKVNHFISPFKLETNDSPKLPLMQAINNPIKISLIANN